LPDLFAAIFAGYNDSLFEGVNAVIAGGLTAMATVLQILGVMFVAVFGYLTLTGNMSPKAGMSMVMRILLVQAAMTPVYYNQYVRDVMLDWLPNWIAQAVGTGNGVDAGAAQFDQLRAAVIIMQNHLIEMASGWTEIPERVIIWTLGGFAQIMVAVAFFVWCFTRAILALIVSIGPFVVVAYLFNATRSFAENWLGKLGGIGVLLILVSVLLKIIVVQFGVFMRRALVEGTTVQEGIVAYYGVIIAMLFGVGLLLYLPRLAFSIGSGAAFDGAGGARAVAFAAIGAARSAAAAARVAGRGARAASIGARAASKAAQARLGGSSSRVGTP
jgi:type IV secretion system protein VirB6